MKITHYLCLALLCCFTAQSLLAKMLDLENSINTIIAGNKLKLGVAIYDFSSDETLLINGGDRFPMQSVYKFQIGLAVLNCVDKGDSSLSEMINITKKDLSPNLWSPIREAYPNGVALPLSDVIEYAVAQSDNTASDLLISYIGGVDKVQNYIISKGIQQMKIANTEREIQSSWGVQFKNWTTPNAMLELLKQFNLGKLLNSDTHNFMWKVMVKTQTGSIRRLLPPNLVVAHKSGHSGKGKKGITAANNDVGIMELPDGRRIAFVIFITESSESSETNYNVIARLGATIYNHFMAQKL